MNLFIFKKAQSYLPATRSASEQGPASLQKHLQNIVCSKQNETVCI